MALDRAHAQTFRSFYTRGRHDHRAPGSECHIALPENDGHTPVILGEPGDDALLAIITLENLGLVLNPFTRTLQPMRMMLD